MNLIERLRHPDDCHHEVANDGKNYANELLAKQSAEIEKLRQFHHDQQELHEMNESVRQNN